MHTSELVWPAAPAKPVLADSPREGCDMVAKMSANDMLALLQEGGWQQPNRFWVAWMLSLA